LYLRGNHFVTRTNGFLLNKAEMALETRQLF
jgi:hypothetical protein